jgi:hypothetical protein
MVYLKTLLVLVSVALLQLSLSSTPLFAESESEAFLPTWRLLGEEKQVFISGYMAGLRDAGKIIDIAIQYVKNNPEEAVTSLERIKQLYAVGEEVKPAQLAHAIDTFYSDPDNSKASLSKAVMSARVSE